LFLLTGEERKQGMVGGGVTSSSLSSLSGGEKEGKRKEGIGLMTSFQFSHHHWKKREGKGKGQVSGAIYSFSPHALEGGKKKRKNSPAFAQGRSLVPCTPRRRKKEKKKASRPFICWWRKGGRAACWKRPHVRLLHRPCYEEREKKKRGGRKALRVAIGRNERKEKKRTGPQRGKVRAAHLIPTRQHHKWIEGKEGGRGTCLVPGGRKRRKRGKGR